MLVQIKKVFNKKGVIHYPCVSTTLTKCACNRLSHGQIKHSCDFYLYGQYGRPPFFILELKSRLRRYNELIEYPECQYSSDDTTETSIHDIVPTLNEFVLEQNRLDESQSIAFNDEISTASMDMVTENELTLTSDVLELINSSQDSDYDSDVESVQSEDEPTPQEIQMATDVSFNETLEKIISDADKLCDIQQVEAIISQNEEDDLQVDELPKSSKHQTVLGDIFHYMDRAKLPMRHVYKALFFRALRSTVFIMNKNEVEDVKTVLQSKGVSWESKLAFDFSYIAQRVRRKVPPSDMLYHRMETVFQFFQNKKDTTTGVVLFSAKN